MKDKLSCGYWTGDSLTATRSDSEEGKIMLIYCKKLTQTDDYLGVVCSSDYLDTIDDISWLKLRCDGRDVLVRQRGYDTFDSSSSNDIPRSVLLGDMAIQNGFELEFQNHPGDVDGKFLSSNDSRSISVDVRLRFYEIDLLQLESVKRFIHKLVEFESLVAVPQHTTARLSDEMSEYFEKANFKQGHCIPVLVGRNDHQVRGVFVMTQAFGLNWKGTLHVADSALEAMDGTDVYAWRNEDEPVLLGQVSTVLSVRSNPDATSSC